MRIFTLVFLALLVLALATKNKTECVGLVFDFKGTYPKIKVITAQGWVSVWVNDESKREMIEMVQK